MLTLCNHRTTFAVDRAKMPQFRWRYLVFSDAPPPTSGGGDSEGKIMGEIMSGGGDYEQGGPGEGGSGMGISSGHRGTS